MNEGKLVLTGVTGAKSGGVLAEYISENIDAVKKLFPGGIVVVCREKSDTRKVERLLKDAEIRRGDFKRDGFLSSCFAGADTVVHVAGISLSRWVVDAAISENVRRLVLVHTTGIYSKYKAAGEKYRQTDEYVENGCRDNNILLTVLRPTMIYGNTSDNNVVDFIRMADRFPVMPVVGGARFELQPVHYKDLGKAYFDVLMNEKVTAGKSYILSGGEVIQLREMLNVIGENLNKKIKFISFPLWFAYCGAWIVYVVSFRRKDFREKVQRLCEPRAYEHEAATDDFGYAPVSFREGVVDEVREYLEKKKK